MKPIPLAAVAYILCSCSSLFRPYPCGPVLNKESIQVFKKQNEFLGLKPGIIFADIGASSGYYDAAMAVFVDSVSFYLNDIDHHCLNERNLKKVLNHYSKLKGKSINNANPFHIVIGTPTSTNLPENTFDVIFSNATMHVIHQPDSILADLYKNLKQDGHLYIRDEFLYNTEVRKCGSKKCDNYLLQFDSFVTLMQRNGFVLRGENHELGHPIYKFAKL
jgi:SAM-dependent methyltransferase